MGGFPRLAKVNSLSDWNLRSGSSTGKGLKAESHPGRMKVSKNDGHSKWISSPDMSKRSVLFHVKIKLLLMGEILHQLMW